ncbi:MAG TPA: hypothetical protein VKB79_30085 [Bryobacteraceae bacterium]|nr:hypothetical protein [Bryobacteraceae bacterium]
MFRQSIGFLVLEEGFRTLTEKGARHTHRPFFEGYAQSIDSLHGWADGDPFLVNYVGHPMQGAVSGYIWVQNDTRYRSIEFGKNRAYWKSRLRAAAFAWAYSEMSEIGPLSEATVGATQASFPQQGFVDHIVTPSIGLAWMLAEDSLDKYVIKSLEQRMGNPYLKLLLRGGLNPSRSLANVLAGEVPWQRYTRPGVFGGRFVKKENTTTLYAKTDTSARPTTPEQYPLVAPWEFSLIAMMQQSGAAPGPCGGGGADIAYRLSPQWQIALQVAGCKMSGLDENVSGDSLTYLAGPRWTPTPADRWSPYVHLLAGGQKLTYETFDPVAKAAITQIYKETGQTPGDAEHALYTSDSANNKFAFKVGAGVDLKLNSAFALRLVGVDYLYSTIHHAGFQVATSLVLRLGTW